MAAGIASKDIDGILGKLFQQFASLAQAGTGSVLQYFTCKNYDQSKPKDCAENDVAPEFAQYIAAMTAAFREIDRPNVATSKFFSEDVPKAFEVGKLADELLTNQSGLAKSEPFNYSAMVYQSNGPLQYLLPGSTLFSYDSIDPNLQVANSQNSPFVNLVTYLYYFISQLNLNNTSGKSVIDFLNENDKLTYSKYFDETIKHILAASKANLPYLDASNVSNGLSNLLVAVANKIINELKFSGLLDDQAIRTKFVGLPSLSDTDLKSVLNDLGANSALVINELKKIKKLGEPEGKNAKAPGGGIQPYNEQEVKTILLNGLFNYPYLNTAVYSDKINAMAAPVAVRPAVTGPGGISFGTVKPKTPAVVGVGKPEAPNFLYGHADVTGDRYHISVKDIGTTKEVQFVTSDVNGRTVEDIIDALQRVKINNLATNAGIKALVLAIVYEAIENNLDLSNIQIQALKRRIGDNLTGKFTILSRLQNAKFVKNNLSSAYNKFVDDINKILPLTVSGPYVKASSLTGTPVARTFADPSIANLYKVITENAQNINLYDKYLNVVNVKNGMAYKIGDGNIDLKNPDDYRLNVKRIGRNSLNQVGGAKPRLYDPVFLELIPEVGSDVGKIYISLTDFLPQDVVRANPDILIDAVRNAFVSTDPGFTFPGTGKIVQVSDTVRNITMLPGLTLNWNKVYQQMLKNPFTLTPIAQREKWEKAFGKHMLDNQSLWRREQIGDDPNNPGNNEFVLYDDKGNKVDTVPDDNCKIINQVGQECMDILTGCALDQSLNFGDACRKIVNIPADKFMFNVSQTALKQDVLKINPKIAFGILRKFGFGTYFGHISKNPLIRGYRVQSVGDWLSNFPSVAKSGCAPGVIPAAPNPDCVPPFMNANDKDILLDKILNNPNLLKYFDVLVDWVNANPAVLNPEYDTGRVITPDYKPADPSYRTYQYLSTDREKQILQLRTTCNDLYRIKSLIVNDMTGFSGRGLISTMATVPPLGIDLPLNPRAFVTPFQTTDFLGQFGGGYSDLETADLDRALGYESLKALYDSLKTTMGQIDSKNKISLQASSDQNINDKLNKLKETENALRESLKRLIIKNKIYYNSRGNINIDERDPQYDLLLAKHSNLLNLNAAYNKRAINLIDIFQTIINALLGKLENKNMRSSKQVSTPMYMGYFQEKDLIPK